MEPNRAKMRKMVRAEAVETCAILTEARDYLSCARDGDEIIGYLAVEMRDLIASIARVNA